MKTRTDLAKNWLLKAQSDLANARLCISAGQSLDTACFHAQQALDMAQTICDAVAERLPASARLDATPPSKEQDE